MARERAKAKPEPLARGGAKAKPRLRAVAKTRAAHKAKAAERGPPPRLLRFSWTLCLRPPTSCTFRVAATTRAALAGTPGSATTSGTTVRCEPSSVEAAQGAHRSERWVPSQPSGTGESASATPRRQPPTPPKAPPRDQHGRKLESEATDAAHGGGPPSPTGDSYESSTEAAEEANPARPGTPTPWARRTARKTTAARSAALPAAQHVSQAPVAPEAWEPDAMEAGSLSPPLSEWEWPSTPRGPNQGGFASLSEVAAALPSVPLGGLEAAAWRLAQSQPWLMVAS